MTDIIDIRTCDDPRDVIHRVVERLAAGDFVGLPTETSYVVATQASHSDAASRLRDIIGQPLVVAVKGADEALDFLPTLDIQGERLLRRLMPGPVIIEGTATAEGGLFQAFPPAVQRAVECEGRFQIRSSEQEIFAAIQRLVAAPLLMSPEPVTGPITNPATLRERLNITLPLVLDDGPPLVLGRCTLLQVFDGRWKISQPGVLTEVAIQELSCTGIVFVCTGNTCRSPLAEAMFRKMLAERLDCSEDELVGRGYFVASAGISAGYDMPAAAESLALAEEFGLRLAAHRSRPLTDELLARADYVFAMTAGHREAILAARPDLAGRIHLLSREGLDIADPIGGGPAEYERCRAEIERELLAVLEALPIDPPHTRG